MVIENEKVIEQFLVPHGKSIKLKDFDPGWAGDTKRPTAERKRFADPPLGGKQIRTRRRLRAGGHIGCCGHFGAGRRGE